MSPGSLSEWTKWTSFQSLKFWINSGTRVLLLMLAICVFRKLILKYLQFLMNRPFCCGLLAHLNGFYYSIYIFCFSFWLLGIEWPACLSVRVVDKQGRTHSWKCRHLSFIIKLMWKYVYDLIFLKRVADI